VLSSRLNKARALLAVSKRAEAFAELDEIRSRTDGADDPAMLKHCVLASFNRAQAFIGFDNGAALREYEAFEQRFARSRDPLVQAVRIMLLSGWIRLLCDSRPIDETQARRLIGAMGDVITRLRGVRDKWVALNFLDVVTHSLASFRHPRCAAVAYGAFVAALSALDGEVAISLLCNRMVEFGHGVWPTLRTFHISSEDWAIAFPKAKGVRRMRQRLLLMVGLEGVQPRDAMIRIYKGFELLSDPAAEGIVHEARRRRIMHEAGDDEGLRRKPVLPGDEATVFSQVPMSIPKGVVLAGIKAATDAGQHERAAILSTMLQPKRQPRGA
jgi:hypothetical protein